MMTEEQAWKVYNFVNEWKKGNFGEVDLQSALDKHFDKKCCICGKEFTGWGNNPWPIVDEEDARCCDNCNMMYVVPARLKTFIQKTK